MDNSNANSSTNNTAGLKTALITGSAKRVGAVIAQELHQAGYNVIIHFRSSRQAAENMAAMFNESRPDSAKIIQADLDDETTYNSLIEQACQCWGQLDVLINNASSFYATPIGNITIDDWNKLINSNMKAPLFLSQAAAPYLKETRGCIINMVDIHGQRPMKDHPVYCAAKAGLAMLTLSLARELGPDVRVNGVAPGAILWPASDTSDNALSEQTKNIILERTALKRSGMPIDIAKTILFLIRDADYITGQIIAVDGGRSLNI